MIRLKDIAERAGVSVMTVSKVMRDAKDISGATKARVRKLADELGYVPDVMAQSMRSRTTRLLGLILPSVANPLYARVILALEEKANELGYDLLLTHSLNKPEREEACIRRMISRRVDGLFIFPAYRFGGPTHGYDELRKRGVPTVILGQVADFCRDFVNVEPDDVFASQTATRHLIELGHRRIAYFSGPRTSPTAKDRLEGYQRALREANIPPDDHLIFSAGSTIEEGEATALQMLNEMPDATAIQTFNDLVAIGAANTLLRQGIRIPDDLSMVGFGNILISEHFRVPLTTMRQPKLRLGFAAFELMSALLAGAKPDPRRLPTEIVTRESSGKPPTHRIQRPSAPQPQPPGAAVSSAVSPARAR
jgi:DNA-binding LacI/PurR family transcriptional regulator